MAEPIEQFDIQTIGQPIHVAGLNVSFNNSALYMVVAVVVITALIMLSTRSRALIPGRWQALTELFYDFVADMVRENAGADAKPFFPFVFALFMFLLVGNLQGLIPTFFTFTSHIIVTFSLALVVFIMVTLVAFIRHGFHFFTFFMPHGAPLWLAPILIPIEIVSYLVRPFSLSIRLFVNMMAGHTMMKVFAGFSVGFVATLGGFGYFLGLFPVAINVALTGFEVLVAALQAYVFTILTCLYIRDALELH